jgi:hypothetical protein
MVDRVIALEQKAGDNQAGRFSFYLATTTTQQRLTSAAQPNAKLSLTYFLLTWRHFLSSSCLS